MTEIAAARNGHETDGLSDTAPPMGSDLSEFLPFLDDYEMSLEAKLAFLAALYGLLTTFVDQTFGEEPHQKVLEAADASASQSI